MTAWTRRGFIASGGVAAASGAGMAAAASDGVTAREVPLLHTYVAGAERRAARALRAGAPLRLVREPENDYDPRAVAVWTVEGDTLGYVPRIDNQSLANLMDAGLAPRAHVGSVAADRSRPDIRVEVNLAIS
ncbi:HIRAN domain-containing protein [Palleronia sp.]|uniref:HIRAN domain-containing protein n=1 Tax=Palleronia sp. TaxID=1940284 RepID=UPI0035C7F3F4